MARLLGVLVLVLVGCGGKAAAPAGPPGASAGPPATAAGADDAAGEATGDARQAGVGFVLLTEATLPAAQAIADAHAAVAPDGPPLTVDGPPQDGNVAFTQDGVPVVVGLMPMPVPDNEAEEHARFSVDRILRGWQPPAHKAHLMVMHLGGKDVTPLERTRRVHRVIAAVAQAAGATAVGVYIGHGGVTHEPAFYIEVVGRSPDAIIAWSGVSVARDASGRISALSTGMKQLGLPEILITTSKMEPGEAISTLYDLMLYVARRGERVPAGNTIGYTPTDLNPVRYAPSPADPTAEVMQVDYP